VTDSFWNKYSKEAANNMHQSYCSTSRFKRKCWRRKENFLRLSPRVTMT
jgi:hypothetical protein